MKFSDNLLRIVKPCILYVLYYEVTNHKQYIYLQTKDIYFKSYFDNIYKVVYLFIYTFVNTLCLHSRTSLSKTYAIESNISVLVLQIICYNSARGKFVININH